MKSLKITLVATAIVVVSVIFMSLTPQDQPTHEKDKNSETIVKVTLKKEKKKIEVPNA